MIEFYVLETIPTNRNTEILNNPKSYNNKALKYKQTLTDIKQHRAHIISY